MVNEEDVLAEGALGDEIALLQTPALALATGVIGPDPAARPRPRTVTPDRTPLETTTLEKDLRWGRDAIAILVRTLDGRALGRAELGRVRVRLSEHTTLHAEKSDPEGFALNVLFHVDGGNRSRRPVPFNPPRVGVAWKFRPDSGDWGPVTHLYDATPGYVSPGVPLQTSFGNLFHVPAIESGWWAFSARIEDVVGDVEYDDFVRCLVTD